MSNADVDPRDVVKNDIATELIDYVDGDLDIRYRRHSASWLRVLQGDEQTKRHAPLVTAIASRWAMEAWAARLRDNCERPPEKRCGVAEAVPLKCRNVSPTSCLKCSALSSNAGYADTLQSEGKGSGRGPPGTTNP